MRSRSQIRALAFSPDANKLAAGTRDPGFELWDLAAGTPSRTFKAPGDYFDSEPGFVAFSPDGRFVACGGHGKDIAIFDVAAAALHVELRGHFHAPTAAAFLPDGRLVSGGEERTVRLWDPDAGSLLATWVVVPADSAQDWDDEWVGFGPSGNFVGSARLDRLAGWNTGGRLISDAADPGNRHRVETRFTDNP